MSIVLIRVDDRLVHGQVVEAWAPFCKATCIVVANDEAEQNRVRRTVLESCGSSALAIKVEGIEGTLKDISLERASSERVIVVFSTLKDLMLAHNKGFRFSSVNIGNLHSHNKGKMITPSVYIDEDDEEIMRSLSAFGVKFDIRGVPSDRPAAF